MREEILKRSVGFACSMDADFQIMENLANTFMSLCDTDTTVDGGELMDYCKKNKKELRSEYVFGYDEKDFDLWWDNIGFDEIQWDDELGIVSAYNYYPR